MNVPGIDILINGQIRLDSVFLVLSPGGDGRYYEPIMGQLGSYQNRSCAMSRIIAALAGAASGFQLGY